MRSEPVGGCTDHAEEEEVVEAEEPDVDDDVVDDDVDADDVDVTPVDDNEEDVADEASVEVVEEDVEDVEPASADEDASLDARVSNPTALAFACVPKPMFPSMLNVDERPTMMFKGSGDPASAVRDDYHKSRSVHRSGVRK